MQLPRVFVSYAWDGPTHAAWVERLATSLRTDGVEVVLDQWHAKPGDLLPAFMETEVRESDFVLVICTPKYKLKSEDRSGGVGYETDVITAELFVRSNRRKFIPVLAHGRWQDAAPSWLAGAYYIDLSSTPFSATSYSDLLDTLHRQRREAPPIGTRPQRSAADAPDEHETFIWPADADVFVGRWHCRWQPFSTTSFHALPSTESAPEFELTLDLGPSFGAKPTYAQLSLTNRTDVGIAKRSKTDMTAKVKDGNLHLECQLTSPSTRASQPLKIRSILLLPTNDSSRLRGAVFEAPMSMVAQGIELHRARDA